jgi:hypothetical protein
MILFLKPPKSGRYIVDNLYDQIRMFHCRNLVILHAFRTSLLPHTYLVYLNLSYCDTLAVLSTDSSFGIVTRRVVVLQRNWGSVPGNGKIIIYSQQRPYRIRLPFYAEKAA